MNAAAMNSMATAEQQRRQRRKSRRLSAEEDAVPALSSIPVSSEKPRTRSYDKRVERYRHQQREEVEEFTRNDVVKLNGDAFNPFAAASSADATNDTPQEVSNPLTRMRQQARKKASTGTVSGDNTDPNNGDSKHSASTAATMESSSRSNPQRLSSTEFASFEFQEAITEELVVEVETIPINNYKGYNDSLPCLMGMDSSASSYNLSKDCTLDESSSRLEANSNVINLKMTRDPAGNLNITKTPGMDVSLVDDNINMSCKRDSVRRSDSGPRRSSSNKNKLEKGSSKKSVSGTDKEKHKSSSKSPTGKIDRSEASQGRRRSSSRKTKKSLESGSSRRSMSASGKGSKKRSSSTTSKKKDLDQSSPEQQDRRTRRASSSRKLKEGPPSTRRMSFGGAKHGATMSSGPLRRSLSCEVENRLPPTTHASTAAAQAKEPAQTEGSATMVLETEEIGEGEMEISIVILRDDMKPMEDQSRMSVSKRKANRRGSNESEITTSTRRRDSKAMMKRRGSNGSQLDDGSRAAMKRRGSNGSQLDNGSRAKPMMKRRGSNDGSKMGDGSRARRPSSRRSLVRSDSNGSLSESKGNVKRSNSNPGKVMRAPSNRSMASKGMVRTNSGRSLASSRRGTVARTNSGRSLVSRKGNMVRSQSSRSMASKGPALRRQMSLQTEKPALDTTKDINASWGAVGQSTRRLLMEEEDPFADVSAHNKMSTPKRSQTVTPATPRSRSKWGKLTSDKIRRSLSLSADQQTNKQIGELKVKPTSIPMEKFQSWEDGIKAVCLQRQQQENGHSPKRASPLSPKNNDGNNGRPGLMMSKTMSLRNMSVLNPTNNGNGRPGLMGSKTMSLRSMSVLNPSNVGSDGRPSMMSKAMSVRNMNGLLRQKSYAGLALD